MPDSSYPHDEVCLEGQDTEPQLSTAHSTVHLTFTIVRFLLHLNHGIHCLQGPALASALSKLLTRVFRSQTIQHLGTSAKEEPKENFPRREVRMVTRTSIPIYDHLFQYN